jgi:hypothetical protein
LLTAPANILTHLREKIDAWPLGGLLGSEVSDA